MKKEWFDKLSEIDKANEAIIGIQELEPYTYNRTLLYGYTCERETFHVYVKGRKIYTVVYNTEYAINYNKELGSFTRGEPKLNGMRQIEVKSNRDFIPNKRLYPERCDYHFCRALKEKGIDLPFTHWSEEVQPNERGYYGFTLEDAENKED
jgi:hypothetical protein